MHKEEINENKGPSTLDDLLDLIEKSAKDRERIKMEMILETIGRRSYGPILLMLGLITLAPVVGDIPGVPTIMGITVILISVQLIAGREYFWLPTWILNKSIEEKKLCKAVNFLRKPARFMDRWLKARMPALTGKNSTFIVAIICTAIGMLMPVMEVIPFSANGAGIALSAFGFSLIGRDGLWALIAYIFTLATYGVVIYGLFNWI